MSQRLFLSDVLTVTPLSDFDRYYYAHAMTDYGCIAFPCGEERCLTKGQMLTDRMMDYLAYKIISGSADKNYHYIPTFIHQIYGLNWSEYDNYTKTFAFLNHGNHWFLVVYEPGAQVCHLYDPLSSPEESPVDIEEIGGIIEYHYGSIPNQGNSKTNCGIFCLLYLMFMYSEMPLVFEGESRHINTQIRPMLKIFLNDQISVHELVSRITTT